MRISSLLLPMTALLAVPHPAPAGDIQTLLVLKPTPEFPRHSEGDLVEFEDGRLGLVYTRFTGGRHDNSAADIVLRIADASGHTWGDPRLLVPRGDWQNVMSVSTVRADDGGWLLFYLRKGERWNDCHLLCRRTADEFRTLSEPVRVTVIDGYHVVNNDRVVRLSTGRLIVPSALHPCPDGTRKTWSARATCMAFISDDDGRTWRPQAGPGVRAESESRSDLKDSNRGQASTASAPSAAKSLRRGAAELVTLQEPGIVELKDGRLMMWMRTSDTTQYQSFSSDGGDHWSGPTPGPLISARLSPASIQRIPWTGDLLAVWNDHSGLRDGPTRNRTPLSIAISRDDGRSWSPSRPIETKPDGSYCYTSITFFDEQAILTYCAGDKSVGALNRLKVTALPREWLE